VFKRRELPVFAIVNEKERPHPWDTHHQFSIKTLLSKEKQPNRYEIGTTNAPQCSVPVVRDHTFGPKIVENCVNYSTAPKMNMSRSARGNLVQ